MSGGILGPRRPDGHFPGKDPRPLRGGFAVDPQTAPADPTGPLDLPACPRAWGHFQCNIPLKCFFGCKRDATGRLKG